VGTGVCAELVCRASSSNGKKNEMPRGRIVTSPLHKGLVLGIVRGFKSAWLVKLCFHYSLVGNRVRELFCMQIFTDAREDFCVHGFGDAAGLRILLAGVEDAEQVGEAGADCGFGSVGEFVCRA
jgi:hypothetical protein